MEPNKWYDLKYTNATIYTEFGSVKVIKHNIFADLIGLSGVLRQEFEIAIELDYNYNALKHEDSYKVDKQLVQILFKDFLSTFK